MTFTITLPAIILMVVSGTFFILATVVCIWQGLFDGASCDYGVGGLFAILIYSLLWAIPSLTIWAIYATWWTP